MENYQLSPQEVLENLKSDSLNGLSKTEVQTRLSQYGPNELVEHGQKSPWKIFFSQFKEVMVIVLLIAALVSAFLGEFTEVIVILAIVALNAILGF
ncbi:MAG TPA: ATPase, partial [Chloroflexi bacterium]|nr:ATPase [Chloroflexota bacterium]